MPNPPPPKEGGTRGDHILLGRFLAAVDLIARMGATSFTCAFDDDLGELSPVEVLWRAEADFKGHRKFSGYYNYPAQAAEDLLCKLGNGGRCAHCKRQVIIGVLTDDYCAQLLECDDLDNEGTYRYQRTCE